MSKAHGMSKIALAVLAITLPFPASASKDITIARGWRLIDEVETGTCRADIIGNGLFYRISAVGFRSGEPVRYRLTNDAAQEIDGRIPGVEYRLSAGADGTFRQFYIPFIPNRTGGRVTISLTSTSCNIQLGFDWRRRSV